jgi:hypothetical protein
VSPQLNVVAFHRRKNCPQIYANLRELVLREFMRRENSRFSGIFRDAPPNVGRIANPTYAAPPDMLVYHGNSQ